MTEQTPEIDLDAWAERATSTLNKVVTAFEDANRSIGRLGTEIDSLHADLAAAIARADKAEAERDMWAAVSGEWEKQMGQLRPGRVTDDALFEANQAIAKERDEARAWLDRHEKNFRDAALALGNWLFVPPDGGDLTLAEGVDRIKAELEAVKAERDAASVALECRTEERDAVEAPMTEICEMLGNDDCDDAPGAVRRTLETLATKTALIEKEVEALKRIVNMESHVARSHIREFAAETLADIKKGEGT